jgi:hypothetical protein
VSMILDKRAELHRLAEKRKVGGSTPPLTTTIEDSETCADLRSCHQTIAATNISGWPPLPVCDRD